MFPNNFRLNNGMSQKVPATNLIINNNKNIIRHSMHFIERVLINEIGAFIAYCICMQHFNLFVLF